MLKGLLDKNHRKLSTEKCEISADCDKLRRFSCEIVIPGDTAG